MIELDPATRRVLLERAGPPTGSRERVLAGLRTSLGPGPGGPGGSGEGAPPGPSTGGGELALTAGAGQAASLVWAAKVVGLTLGLASAGLGALALGSAVSRSFDAQAPAGVRAERSLPPGPTPSTPVAVAADRPTELDEQTADGHGARVSLAPKPRRASPTQEPATPNPSEPTASSLDAELALIRAAKRESDPRAALAILDRHQARFESGELARERDALRVELLCALGEDAVANEARAKFVARYPDAPVHPKRCHP